MRVAIIGVGNVGKALGSAAVAAGHSVVLTASDPAHAVAAAQPSARPRRRPTPKP